MKGSTLRNFHVPLPDDVYKQPHAEAERSQQPATALARAAIAWWLQQRRKATLHEAICAYAAQYAGTAADVDQALEAASVEHLLAEEEDVLLHRECSHLGEMIDAWPPTWYGSARGAWFAALVA
jgi:hypothetical protein